MPDWLLPLTVLAVFGPVVYWSVSHEHDAPRRRPARPRHALTRGHRRG